MKFCRYCGAQISDTAAFCPKCGGKIQSAPADSGYGRQTADGYGRQAGRQAAAGKTGAAKKAKKGGALGTLGKVAVAGIAALAIGNVAKGIVGGVPGGGSGGGNTPTYPYQQAGGSTSSGKTGGNAGSGKAGSASGDAGKTTAKAASPISGGKIVSVNKPLRILGETGYSAYELLDVIEEYGKDAPSHIEVLPANNTVSINGDKITIKLPNVAFKSMIRRIEGVDPRTMIATRDELTIYGTISETGKTVEGEAFYESERTGDRPLYYAAGVIDRVEGVITGGAFSAQTKDEGTGSYEHITMRNMTGHPRTGEDYEFSKFSVDYFPGDDYYMVSIFLYGDREEQRYYPTLDEDDYVPHITYDFPKGRYSIMLISDYDAREASRFATGVWK
ncbi:MAG: zinc ribbon domain-containing protein [Stomatobaculum sp.]|nr:zinc ribbon domain-containing protein [Stomatobaculum sp.]